jgi:hypothetical protein
MPYAAVNVRSNRSESRWAFKWMIRRSRQRCWRLRYVTLRDTCRIAKRGKQVMLTKDHNKWNFETLLDLIEGPLLNPKRMEEAIKLSRFLRRLMNFFHPFSHRFSDIERIKVSTLEDLQ